MGKYEAEEDSEVKNEGTKERGIFRGPKKRRRGGGSKRRHRGSALATDEAGSRSTVSGVEKPLGLFFLDASSSRPRPFLFCTPLVGESLPWLRMLLRAANKPEWKAKNQDRV